MYRGKLILYGCGDLINDYEGISGYDKYRDDLRILYFASIAPDTGNLSNLRMVPMQARKGRASYLGERSVGHQDPGATSTALILAALERTVAEES